MKNKFRHQPEKPMDLPIGPAPPPPSSGIDKIKIELIIKLLRERR